MKRWCYMVGFGHYPPAARPRPAWCLFRVRLVRVGRQFGARVGSDWQPLGARLVPACRPRGGRLVPA